MKLILKNFGLLLYAFILAIRPIDIEAKTDVDSISCAGIFEPITSGYGSDSISSIQVEQQDRVPFRHSSIYLFRPESLFVRVPVFFFFHALGADDVRSYEKLLKHIASRGYCVVLPTYHLKSFPFQRRTYKRLLNSCIAAVKYFEKYIDTTRIGVMGHSFGASTVPYLTWRFITERNWGGAGAFMYLMAPHFVFEITQEQLHQFPQQVKMIVEVFADDDCNDHRMAKDIFETIAIPSSEKEFIILFSDTNASTGCRITADHALPTSFKNGRETVDVLDFYGVYRYFDALADYTFNGTPAAREIALGHGTPAQCFMGEWPDGTPVREALISSDAPLVKPKRFFFFHWSHPWNYRRRKNKLWMPDSATWKP